MAPLPARPGTRPSEGRKSASWFLWFALLLGGVVAGAYGWGIWTIARPDRAPKIFGWGASRHGDQWIVSEVDPSGAAAGRLQSGDRLLAFNDDARAARIGPELFMHFLPPGSAYTVRVRRVSGAETTVNMDLPNRPPNGFRLAQVLGLIPGLICLLVGLLMVLVRPDYRLAQLGCAVFLIGSVRLLYLSLHSYGGTGLNATSILILGLWWASENWQLVLGFHFLFRFFANVLKERLWAVLVSALYMIAVLFCAVNFVWAALLLRGLTTAAGVVSRHTTLASIRDVLTNQFRHGFEAGVAVLIISSLAFGYRRVQDSDQRRRVRWLVFGSIAGMAPFLVCIIFFLLWDAWQGKPASGQQWFARLNVPNYGLMMVPIVCAYAVVKHRILGIEVVVRQGLKYLLARNVLRIVLILPIVGLVLPIVSHPDQPLTAALGRNSLYLNLALLIALGASARYRSRLGTWLDRRFFREAHDRERVLNDLIVRIADLDSLADISALVSERLSATLHPGSVAVLYRETARSEMKLRCRAGSGIVAGPALPDNSRLLRLAREAKMPLDSVSLERAGLSEGERDWLQSMNARLVVPIGTANQPRAGMLLLGEKRSEEPYSPAELSLLQGIATQMAVMYERIWLREQVEADRRLRYEVLAHVDGQAVDLLKECPACGVCYDNREETCVHDGSRLIHTLPVPRAIEARYRLELRIGQGGMGAVFEATDLRLHRKVAIKVLVGKFFGNPAALRRFEREAEACARLAHANIIAIHDFGRIGQEGAYLVMDRLTGRTLRSELKSKGKLAPAASVEWYDQFLDGLQAAHGAGIAHRDLKPENVFLTPLELGGDRVTILDFGLAKLSLEESAEPESLTMPGTVLGTLGYMSPEQLSGQASDQQSDLFSTGVIVYEGIAGGLPFRGNTYRELLRAMSLDAPTLAGDSVEIVRLNGVLRRALAPNRSERFRTASELRRELLPALRAWAGSR
jgi:serine/threonine-protein kinase